jgi:sigma-B regulation protein RsbU (phosphoserine phosphatase)
MLGPIANAYQIFWDGQLIGQFGELPPSAIWFTPRWSVFGVPVRFARPGDHIIAIRIWNGGLKWASQTSSLVPSDGRVGELPALREAQSACITRDFRPNSLQLLVSFTILLAGFYFLVLPSSVSEGSAFRWFGLLLVGRASNGLGAFYATNGPLGLSDWLLAGISGWMLTLSFVAAIEFTFTLFRRRVPTAIRGVELLLFLLITLLFAPRLFLELYPLWKLVFWNAALATSLIPVSIAFIEFRRRFRGAEVILVLLIISSAANLMNLLDRAYELKVPTALDLLGFRLWYSDAALILWIPTMAMQIHKVNQRFRDDRERLRGEMEAARHIQQLLLPSRVSHMSGFDIDVIYQPATEVGGDFFQLFSASKDSLLVVVGDVSGKGMKAALLVCVVVGALQNRKSDSPATLLGQLNSVLLGRSEGGFTTCCCALFASNGTLTVANAGHLAPYRNGKEVETQPDLPLGIDVNAHWSQTSIDLQPGDRVLWISDGVVEARNGKRDLLGFHRAQELATQSASEIAQAAQQFGQEDDITVVSITRQPVPVYVA